VKHALKDQMTVTEVAEHFRVSKAWVRDHAAGRRKPVLPCIPLGKLMRFYPSDLEEFEQKMKQEHGARLLKKGAA